MSSFLAVTAFAASFNPSPSGVCELEVTLKKADPDDVVKDGVIGQYEYERYDVDLDPSSTYLDMGFGSSAVYDQSEAMLSTMEYYFSWDEVHGLNFAVRFKPEYLRQEHEEGTGDRPGDAFLIDSGIQFSGDYGVMFEERPDTGWCDLFYYAISKRTDNGNYLEGHYNQLGLKGAYDPEAEKDYIITYPGDGSVFCEWSIPFDNFTTEYDPGDTVYFTICCSGTVEDVSGFSNPIEATYTVSLGDYGFLIKQTKDVSRHLTAHVSDEAIKEEIKFTDVDPEAYYADAVDWAVANDITNGTSDTTFSPNKGCTRGQVVTFLYRAAGEPDLTSNSNPFTDVKSGDYYYNAVLWAVSQGITKGTSADKFSPNATCTRGQIVTFLYRASGSPAISSSFNPFKDVKEADYFYDAVLWAVSENITKGTSETMFDPSSTCTRGQVVTFLYRSNQE